MLNLDYATLEAVQIEHMLDVVDITHNTAYTDAYGDVVYSGIVQSGVACGFRFTTGNQTDKGSDVILDYDAELRIGLTVAIGINDLITLKQKAGKTHSEVFKVWEYPKFNSSRQCVYLKRKND